jgi:hypothetical protein
VLLLICRLFTKSFDQRPPRQICLDDVFVALGEASGGAGFYVSLSYRQPRVSACVLHHLQHFAARFAQVLVGLLVCGVAHCQEQVTLLFAHLLPHGWGPGINVVMIAPGPGW